MTLAAHVISDKMDDILPGLMVVAIAISMIFVLLKFIPYYISAKKLAYALKDIPGDPPHWLWGNLVGVSISTPTDC